MTTSSDPLVEALKQLRLYGCVARVEEIRGEPWLVRVMEIEREERTRRSLVHRSHLAGVGTFKALSDFDWAWPKTIDRAQVERGQRADDLRHGRGCDSVAEPPAAHAVTLRERVCAHDMIEHVRLGEDAVVLALPNHVAIRFVAEDRDVRSANNVSDCLQVFFCRDAAGRVVR